MTSLKKLLLYMLLIALTLLLFAGCSLSGETLLYAAPLGISQADFETLIHAQPKSALEVLSAKQVFYDDITYNGYSCDMICIFEQDNLISVRYIFPKSVQWTQPFYLDTIQKLEEKYFAQTPNDSVEGVNKHQYTVDILTVNAFETEEAYCIEVHVSNTAQVISDIAFDMEHQPQIFAIEHILASVPEDYNTDAMTQEEKTVLCRFLLRMECKEYDLASEFLDNNLSCSLQTTPFFSEGVAVSSAYRLLNNFQIVLTNEETGVQWHICLYSGESAQGSMIYSFYMTK
ncbi:MAG: hypothetical protein ACYCX2_06200 [Christensenellales bacterium]